jgi:hypothetical protein
VEVTDIIIKIKISKVTENNTQIKISSLKEAEGEDQMRNQPYNAITTKNMGTVNLNAGRSNQINSQVEHMCQIIREKPQEVCFSHARRLKNNLKITTRPLEHPLVKVQKYTKFVQQSSCIFAHTISCNKTTQRPPKYIQCVDVWFKRLQYSLE